MKINKTLLISVSVAFMLLGYNNCSGVGFTTNSDGSNTGLGNPSHPGGPSPTPTPTNPNPGPTPMPTPTPTAPPDPRVPDVVKNCNDAVANGTIKTLNQNVDFADTKVETGRTQVCEFGVGDNLPIKDGFMRARYEQYRTLNLPANAVICDVKMTTAQQKFKYDDILFLTYNGRILGSDNKTAIKARLSPDSMEILSNNKMVPLYKYDWLSLRDYAFQNVADDYCAAADQGGGSCQWPITEQTGNIIFQFDPSLLIAIGLKAPSDQQTFGFIMTGDNDLTSDCYHEDLQFSMTVKYYLK